MKNSFSGYCYRDWLIAAVIALLILLVAGLQLTPGMPQWGDDFAAYLSEGISISNDTVEDQLVKNYTLHPTDMPDEAENDTLVYVWGFPLLLSAVHRLVGFDTVTYSSILYYKLPSLFSFALTAGVLYLFYRRFFSRGLSSFLSLIFCTSGNMISAINELNVDIPFLFFFMLSLWLAECFFSSVPDKRMTPLLSVFLGLSLWLTYITRLNGQTVLIVVALLHIVHITQRRHRYTIRQHLLFFSPYFVFLILSILTEHILPSPTPNVSDIGSLSFQQFLENVRTYCILMADYLAALTGKVDLHIWPVLFLFAAIGFFRDGFRREFLPYTVLLVGTFAVLFLLPYFQGLRYLYNVLPIVLMLIASGGQRVFLWIIKRLPAKRAGSCLSVVAALLLLLAYAPEVQAGFTNSFHASQIGAYDVYSDEAIDIYHYIQSNTDPDDIIAFVKPRALYLNTGRLSIRLHVNGHRLEDAQYFLYSSMVPYTDESWVLTEYADKLQLVYKNKSFELYNVVQ